MKKLTILIILICTGCATIEDATSGLTGCPAEQIKTSDHKSNLAFATWKAEGCGKKFFCTNGSAGGPTCKEAIKD